MMQASPYPTQPGMGPGHPSMAHGHPMQVQHAGHMGQPNAAMMGAMHHGMAGPQVTQGPMVSNMPPNAGTPAPGGPMQNAMAMAHLGAQGPMFQGQHPGVNIGQMMQQNNMTNQMSANMIARQRAMQQMNGQMSGHMMGLQGQMPLNAAQLQKMQMGMPMQHMQQLNPQQQQQVLQQQQRMQQQQHHNSLMAQQAHNQALIQQQHRQQQQAAAQQHQAQQQQVAQAQQMQMSRSQGEQVVTQPPPPVSTPAPQAQPPPQPQSQSQNTPQSQQQTPQQKAQQPPPPTTQAPPPQNPPTPQIKQGDSDEETRPDLAKNQILMDEVMRQNTNQDFIGQCLLQLMLYYDHLAAPQRPLDVNYWQEVMAKYYSPFASVRQQIWNSKTGTDKQYQLRYPSLARFYHSHFKNGIRKIHMQSFEHAQNALPNGGYHVWSKKLFVTHEYDNGTKVISYGTLNVNFDEMQKIESLFIGVKGWDEVIPRSLLEPPASPEQNRQSPKQSKKSLAKQQQQQIPRPLPKSPVGTYGIPQGLQQFLEIAEVITAMDPLIEYYCVNDMNTASEALTRYNTDKQQNPLNRNMQQQNANAAAVNGQLQFPNQRIGGMNPPNNFQSPALAHLNLPNQQSPHMNHTPSPGHPGQGGVQMVHQMSAQGSMSGSQGASTNTSPATNKRRRPSAIKEEDAVQAAAGEGRTKPSPRVGKRQKGAAA